MPHHHPTVRAAARRALGAPAALALLALAACGGSDAVAPTTELTDAEAAAVAAQLGSGLAAGLGDTGAQPARLPLAEGVSAQLGTGPTSITIDQTFPCPGGGTSRVAGTVSATQTASGASVTFALAQTLAGCAVTLEDGRTLLVSTDPTLAIAGAFAFDDAAPIGAQQLTMQGNLRVTGGSAGGVALCPVSLTMTVDPTAGTGTVAGTVCARTVSETASWS